MAPWPGSSAMPPELLMTIRIYLGLYSVLAALEAEIDFRTEFEAELADCRAYEGGAAAGG